MMKTKFIMEQEEGQKRDRRPAVYKISNLVYLAKQMLQIKMSS